jgi:outer membrane protein, multidrug efflux system
MRMKAIWIATAAALLTGCAVGPDVVAPTTSVAPHYAASIDPAYASDAALVQFWQRFDDPALAALIEQALAANHDLRIALANLNEVRALLRESQLELAPIVTAGAGYSEALASADQAPGDRDARRTELYGAGFDAVWELDLFGRLRRAIEAGRATEAARRAFAYAVSAFSVSSSACSTVRS